MIFRSAAFPFLVLLLACSPAYSGQGAAEGKNPDPAHQESPSGRESGPGSEDARIRLVDGKTGEPIADAEVLFEGGIYVSSERRSKNKIKTGWSKKWIRKTDGDGVATLTADILQQGVGYLSTPGYVGQPAPRQPLDDQSIIELDPKEERDKGNYRLKLLDAKTRKKISNRRVWLTRPPKANIWMRRQPDCLPSKCPEYWVGYETNRLGNIYFQLTLPDLIWIYAEGYEFARPPKNWITNGQVFLEKSD